MNQSLFKVVEPSGKEYEVFTDGKISGFATGSIVFNRYSPLLASGVSKSQASEFATSRDVSFCGGAPHSVAL